MPNCACPNCFDEDLVTAYCRDCADNGCDGGACKAWPEYEPAIPESFPTRERFRPLFFKHGFEYIEFWDQPVSKPDSNVVEFVSLGEEPC
jgi:hypothetical protein